MLLPMLQERTGDRRRKKDSPRHPSQEFMGEVVLVGCRCILDMLSQILYDKTIDGGKEYKV